MDESLGVRSRTVSTVALDDELTIFDSATGRALTLNRTASDVFALADGQTSVAEAVSVLARAYAVAPEAIRNDVLAVVRSLHAAGVLVAAET